MPRAAVPAVVGTFPLPSVGGAAVAVESEGAEAFVKSWTDLLDTIKAESERLAA